MTTQREIENMKRLVKIILEQGEVTKVQLVRQSKISISYYEKLKPFIEEMYDNTVRYDKATRTWKSVSEEEAITD